MEVLGRERDGCGWEGSAEHRDRMLFNMAVGKEERTGTRGPGVETGLIFRAPKLPPFIPTSQASHSQACVAHSPAVSAAHWPSVDVS